MKRVKFTKRRQERFLTVLAATCNVSAAAASIGISARHMYHLRRENLEFGLQWQDTLEAALDSLEAALFDRALNGVEEPIVSGGKKICDVRRYDNNLALQILRAHRPKIYREQKSLEFHAHLDLSQARARAKDLLTRNDPVIIDVS